MQHILTSEQPAIEGLLTFFFANGYTRSSPVPERPRGDAFGFRDASVYEKAFDLCLAIYKRGLLNSPQTLQPHCTPPLFLANADELAQHLQKKASLDPFYLVDTNFFFFHRSFFRVFMSITPKPRLFFFKPEEATKTLTSVRKIIARMPETPACLIAMGGGITLDVGGFVAGLLKIPVSFVATTLLSAVDAGIGGKTGVNFFPYGKNQVGLFHQATSLFVVPEFLSVTDFTRVQLYGLKDLACGLAEALKHSWLFATFPDDSPLFHDLLRCPCPAQRQKQLRRLIQKNYLYKAAVVEEDPLETKGKRIALNFGHTLAHVLEGLGEAGLIEKIPHGIAVAYGMSFLLEEGFLPCPVSEFLELAKQLCSVGTLRVRKKILVADIESLVRQDKKKEDAGNNCVLSLPQYGYFCKTTGQGTSCAQAFALQPFAGQILAFIERKNTGK